MENYPKIIPFTPSYMELSRRPLFAYSLEHQQVKGCFLGGILDHVLIII